ncbi:MAG: hypothetical protein KGQ41_09980 [Alphaproteobacteria bacterium]|nr:hypothetical protein [Alphaproteobacteria bacterium]
MTDQPSTGLVCPITGCPIKKILITTIIVMIATYAYDFLFHGVLMRADYEATANLWRSEADMKALFPFCLIYHGVLAFAVSGLYCMYAKGCACGGKCPKTGMKFGLFIGLIVGIGMFSSYIWLPMPLAMAVKWLVGGVVWGLLIGFVLSKVASCCCKKA